jgi:hypothetical protein
LFYSKDGEAVNGVSYTNKDGEVKGDVSVDSSYTGPYGPNSYNRFNDSIAVVQQVGRKMQKLTYRDYKDGKRELWKTEVYEDGRLTKCKCGDGTDSTSYIYEGNNLVMIRNTAHDQWSTVFTYLRNGLIDSKTTISHNNERSTGSYFRKYNYYYDDKRPFIEERK